jgi:AcrR family transcriptional regulator
MGRKPTITRESLLNAAEDIVNNEGPQALTIGALAKAAGISKGGVQYSFSSKDELVKALLERWTSQFDAVLANDVERSPIDFVRSYIAAMRSSQGAMNAKMAGLMIVYMQNPENRQETRDWYRSVLGKIGRSKEAHAARIAFLAMEGLMLMRISGVEDGPEWEELFDDVQIMLGE